MCGRYTETKLVAILRKRFRFRPPGFELVPRYNLAPTQRAPIVRLEPQDRVLELATWGLVPLWDRGSTRAAEAGGRRSPNATSGAKLINARSETVATTPSFRDAFRERRCLVPADGFYEWRKERRGKMPVRFVLRSREPFAFAGLHENGTFTILTTDANPLVAKVHDRMPVILLPENEERWLDPSAKPRELQSLLQPYPEVEMDADDVSPAVSSPKNDDPSLIEPVHAKARPLPPQRDLFET